MMKIKKPARKCTFTVTCTEEEKKELYRRAQEADRTVCGYIRWLIKQSEKNSEESTND